MNHLAHFFLASPNPGLMAGGFLGDHIKGRLSGHYGDDLERGIKLHRAIDVYTDKHIIVKQATRRFTKPYRRFAPIICDIAFDHFLARDWQQFAAIPLEEFCQQSYLTVINSKFDIPAQALQQIKRMQSANSLKSYQNKTFIKQSLAVLSNRISRPNPLASAYDQYLRYECQLNTDFHQFMPDIIKFSNQWTTTNC
ncbi:MAG: DUF479 domain-containing protein [Pseudomonadales bacterium]|nr:DUF479 domain-containing protein [Pseudomonadales bacterium]